MRKITRLAWPALVGLLGGAIALEAQLSYELAIPANYGCLGCKGSSGLPQGVDATLFAWLALGILGPPLVVVIERARVVVRTLTAARRVSPAGVIVSLFVGFWACLVADTMSQVASRVALPWGSLVSPEKTLGISVGLAVAAAVHAMIAGRLFRRRVLPRLVASFVVAIATYIGLGLALGTWFGPA